MPPKVYIDGHVGTTGLRIREWLAGRADIELITAAEDERKNADVRRECVRRADLAVLCLPDEAAREAASWAAESGTKVIDASTAHRIAGGWVYGLPELEPMQRDAIRSASRVTNPGCYASAFVLLARPLIDAGFLTSDTPLSIHALSGYSGGGGTLIEKWEAGLLQLPFEAPYSLGTTHKHIPEMMRYSRLQAEPYFVPAVGPFRCGMRVELPLPAGVLKAGVRPAAVFEAFRARYQGEPFIRLRSLADARDLDELSLDPRACNDTNRIDLAVVAHASGHALAIAILDNLGKGAAGVAVQNLNLMLGLDETSGLSA